MKKRIALGATLLLTLGTAVASTFLYSHEHSAQVVDEASRIQLPSDHQSVAPTVTPEMIAMWKATAASTDYEAPKAPI